ncbi:YolD-like family protein [Gottfriedia solisilvae]|uniref:YolD-like family protein n=1 Tax=Gottfriedia solisilvae TaxID=1516104 RepID=UPI003D2F44F2
MSEQKILGRTSKKWMPFASIPMQFSGIANIISNQSKIQKPSLDENEIERINQILIESNEKKNDIALVYWNNGSFITEIGKIKKIEQINSSIYLIDKFNRVQTILIDQLIDIREI